MSVFPKYWARPTEAQHVKKHGQVAQLVEQRIENPRVDGSIPPLATNKIKHLAQPHPLGFLLPGIHVMAV